MTITDTDLTLLEELEEDVPCEIEFCVSAAGWYMIRPCCDATLALCELHKVMAEFIISIDAYHKCKICETEIASEDIRLEKR